MLFRQAVFIISIEKLLLEMTYPAQIGGILISKSSKKKKDTAVREQLRKKHIFCDFINGTLFHGLGHITPDMLTWLPESGVLKLKGQKGKEIRLDHVKDSVFLAEMPKNQNAIFRVIFGGEGQNYIDYGMVIRDMGYDAGAYLAQLYEKRQKHREKGDIREDEFLSGIKKSDRFIPVITLCFYYGEKEWDASTSLFELLDIPEGEEWIYEYLSDYRLNLVHVGNVKPENFKTGLRQVFELLPFSGDAAKLQTYMEIHKEEFLHVTEETCELLLTFFDDKNMKLLEEKEKFYNEEGGGYDMCTAFQQMREEGIQIGQQIGQEQGEGRVNHLIRLLLQDSRTCDIEKAVSDRDYQNQLFQEYHL